MDEARIATVTTLEPLRTLRGVKEGDLVAVAGVATASEYTRAPTSEQAAVGWRLMVERQPGPITGGLGAPWELIEDSNHVVPFEVDLGEWPVRVEPRGNSAIIVARPRRFDYSRPQRAAPAWVTGVLAPYSAQQRVLRDRWCWREVVIKAGEWVFVVGRVTFGGEIPADGDVYRGSVRRQVVLEPPLLLPLLGQVAAALW